MTDLPALDDDRRGRPTYRVGAVAYKAQVVTIREAFRRWFPEIVAERLERLLRGGGARPATRRHESR